MMKGRVSIGWDGRAIIEGDADSCNPTSRCLSSQWRMVDALPGGCRSGMLALIDTS